MNHLDHVALLKDGLAGSGKTWADLGSGSGAFTLALAELLQPDATIYSIDLDRQALDRQRRAMDARFPGVDLRQLVADFSRPLDLPPLDGLVMANSLHYQQDKSPLLHLSRSYLKPGGRFVLVEYNADLGNPWVPYPISYRTWETVAARAGFVETRLLATRPSRFLGEIYSAVSRRPTAEDTGDSLDMGRSVSREPPAE